MAADKYIVVFEDNVTPAMVDEYAKSITDSGGEVVNRFDNVLNGFSAKISPEKFAEFNSLQGGVIKYIGARRSLRPHLIRD
ncbi:hypothetical protein FISHEDRAFT_71778 [Fistulina hepatica ATCC 64428]|uniref:Inhibitor I9 domain-containing protein n=1 Tax=Fistulina hepatica ATCC 64428 TaxID=1128425 RepID=A0A0D7AFI2_9AGAR|nr:hypothetical protein FISHEDRAFT_71778 [Fistulina hepatica ATCC 64428]